MSLFFFFKINLYNIFSNFLKGNMKDYIMNFNFSFYLYLVFILIFLFMIPFGYNPLSFGHFMLLSFLLYMTTYLYYFNKNKFNLLFFSDSSYFLSVFLFLVHMISNILKTFSLSLRIFINLNIGMFLIKSIFFLSLNINYIFFFTSFLMLYELSIIFIQGFVYLMLVNMYFKM